MHFFVEYLQSSIIEVLVKLMSDMNKFTYFTQVVGVNSGLNEKGIICGQAILDLELLIVCLVVDLQRGKRGPFRTGVSNLLQTLFGVMPAHRRASSTFKYYKNIYIIETEKHLD